MPEIVFVQLVLLKSYFENVAVVAGILFWDTVEKLCDVVTWWHWDDVLVCLVFQYDPGFQEDPSQPFSDSEDDINDTDGEFWCDAGNLFIQHLAYLSIFPHVLDNLKFADWQC